MSTEGAFARTTLPSGIRVVTHPMPDQRSVSIGAWIGAGSRDEPRELLGVTHFLEHLLFKGTPARAAIDIARTFDSIGGDLNAFTAKEFTCVHARTLAEHVPMTVETIADMLRNALLAPADVEAERNVVLEEIAMHEDVPDELAFDLFHETLWGEHPLRYRVQGYDDTIAEMSRDAVAGYYGERYRPPGIVVAAAGPLEHDRIAELVDAAFGDTTAGMPAPLRAHAEVPEVSGAVEIRERDVEQAHLVYGTRGIARSDDRRWALGILNTALGGGMSSRLFQEIREKRGLAYAVSSGHQGFAETGAFTVYVGCSTERVSEVMRIVKDEIAAVAEEGVSADELARAAGHLRGGLVISLDDSGSLMSHLGKSELCLGEIPTAAEMIRQIEAVTLDDVRALAREILTTQPWSLALLAPDADGALGPLSEVVA